MSGWRGDGWLAQLLLLAGSFRIALIRSASSETMAFALRMFSYAALYKESEGLTDGRGGAL